MYVYRTGAKERAAAKSILTVAPAGHVTKGMDKNAMPAEWLDPQNKPRTFDIEFHYGRAAVDEQLGNWLVETGQVSRTSIVRDAGKSMLGSLARTIAGR